MTDNQDVALKIRVLDPQGNFLGGKVDLEFKHRTLNEPARTSPGLDASCEINIRGLRRAPQGAYLVTVTPSGHNDPQPQFINIPASGSTTVDFKFQKQTPPKDPSSEPSTKPDGSGHGDDRGNGDEKDIVLKIRVLNSQGCFLGGKVDLEFKHQTLNEAPPQKGVDATQEISITGLRRAPMGEYQVSVTPTDLFDRQSKFINMPASGTATEDFVFSRPVDHPDPTRFVVRGTVRDGNGTAKPLANVKVRAFDKDLRSEELLGQAITDGAGNYQITYTAAQFQRAEKGTADLRVAVCDAGDRELVSSGIHFNALPETTIDLIVGTGSSLPSDVPSEFERHMADLVPVVQGVALIDIDAEKPEDKEKDLDFLAGDTGIDRQHIIWLIRAAACEEKSKTADSDPGHVSRGRVPSAAFYGWFRLNLPTDLSALWASPTEQLLATLSAAIAQQIVPSNIAVNLGDIRARIEQIKLDLVLQAPAPGINASLAALLATLPAPLSSSQQRAIASAVTGLRPDDQELVKRISDIPGFDGDAIGVARTLRLGALTEGHLPMTQALQGRLQVSAEPQGTLLPLAALRPDEWLALAYTHGVPAGMATTPVAYAQALAARVEQQHPTAALAAHLSDGRRLAQQPALKSVGTFLRVNPSFNIVTANLNTVSKQSKLDGVADPRQLVEGLQVLQRMNVLGASWAETAILMENNFHSPHQLLMAGPTQLTARLDGKIEPARVATLYGEAQDLHDITFAAITSAFSPFSGPQIRLPIGGDPVNPGQDGGSGSNFNLKKAIENLTGARGFKFSQYTIPFDGRPPNVFFPSEPKLSFGDAIDHQPTLRGLFGDQDERACGPCNSVLSPAAYFVDLLQFVKNADQQKVMIEQLLRRRPDLLDLELSCENTNTEVLAIDLALEILENAVAFDSPLDVLLPSGTNAEEELQRTTVGPNIRKALEETVPIHVGEARAIPPKAGTNDSDWTVADGHRRWTLTAKARTALQATMHNNTIRELETSDLDLPALIAALDRGGITSNAEAPFARLFAEPYAPPLDLANYVVTATPLSAGKSWSVSWQFTTKVLVDFSKKTLTLQTPAGAEIYHLDCSQPIINDVTSDLSDENKEEPPPLVEALITDHIRNAPASGGFKLTPERVNPWVIVSSRKEELTLSFTPARIAITSLTYQSGDAGADAIAWPENHNPAAYAKLKGDGVCFPWTLPVDLPLEQERLFLERAHCSRRRLIELMLPLDQKLKDSATLAREVLGLSEAEARLIAPAPGPPDAAILSYWGVSTDQKTIWDAASDSVMNGESGLNLLQNVSILLQQSRLTFEQLQAVLATRFVSSGTAPLRIVSPATGKPGQMEIPDLKPGHLDRIHRFVRLQRRLGWPAQDLDTAIPKDDRLDETTLRRLAHLVRIRELLDLPLAVVLTWYDAATPDNQKKRVLGRALGLRSDELDHAVALFEIASPFENPSATLGFCERVKDFQRGGIAFEDLRYLLQHVKTPGSNAVLDEDPDEKELRALADVARGAVCSIPGTAGAASLSLNDGIGALAADAAIAALATRLGAARELVDDLLRNRLRDPSNPSKAAINVFLSVGEPSQPPSPAVKSVLVRLHKAVFLCNALRLSRTDLALLRASATDTCGFTALDFNTLPATTIDTAGSIDDFDQLLALVLLRGSGTGAADMLRHYAALNFADGTVTQNAQQLLAVGLMLVINEVKNPVKEAAEHLTITAAKQYRDPLALTRLIELLTALKQLGATVAQVRPQVPPLPNTPNGLTAASPNDWDAETALELLRGKYGESQWHDLIKPVADSLRERQRNALVDYLIARDQAGQSNFQVYTGERARDANDLYERYLIDVQTGTCLKTTRLLQATAAVQLFVQRWILNLEKGPLLDDDHRKLWDWMHSYRVWEANRKVFLFPENWLLPELRDDKTAIFRQMESTLTQQEASEESARTALLGYLDDLGDLAQIKVIAMYEHLRQEARTLYVVGRTPNQPYRYFWRSCTQFGDPDMSWSGWEAMDLDNANDFIMPFVLEGDLHVAWPTFRKTTDDVDNQKLLWAIQINWMRRTNQGWTKRKCSHETLSAPRLLALTELRSFVFQVRKSEILIPMASNLTQECINIDCYPADEAKTIPTYSIRGDEIDQPPIHGKDKPPIGIPPLGGWWNVFLTVSGKVYENYKQDDSDILRPANGSTARLTYKFLNDDQLHYLAPPESTISIDLHTDPKGSFDFGTVRVKNRSEVTLTFYPGIGSTPLNESTSKPISASMVTPDDKKEEYQEWFWKPAHVLEICPPGNTEYGPGRAVTFKEARGSFQLEPSRDMRIVPGDGGCELEADFSERLGNGFIFGRGNAVTLSTDSTRKVRPVLAVDHPFGELVEIISATIPLPAGLAQENGIWHLQDVAGPYYVRRATAGLTWNVWPDGQGFVGWYRRRAAASIPELFDRSTQARPRNSAQTPRPLPPVLSTTSSAISFDRTMPYANYNWELFLHAPLAIADYLAGQQHFADARRWLHAVFDPTTPAPPNGVPQFWRFLPFNNDAQPETIAELLTWLADPNTADGAVESRLTQDIKKWQLNPFMPHLIARLRPSAYQWYTFFAYLDLLIGWGDQLFRRDTRESVNEATLLYVLAAKLLGPRPRTIPAATPPPPQTYRSLQTAPNQIDDFSNAWIAYADLPGVKKLKQRTYQKRQTIQGSDSPAPPAPPAPKILTSLGALAFCIPRNEKLTEYYDRVENRLFNVRHCLNIDGAFRDLPLYEPPIDPLLLIRARAAGLDIESVVAGLDAKLRLNYRFSFMLQKALELCSELKALGGALLAALEKQDAEELALLRSRHEIAMLKLVRATRQRQVDEAEANIAALQQSEETILERFSQYQKLLGKPCIVKGQDGLPVVEQSSSLAVATDSVGEGSGLGLISREVNQLFLTAVANESTQNANQMHAIAGILSMIPNIWSGSALVAGSTFGGSNLGSGASAIAKAIEMGAVEASYFANKMGTFAGYERRQDEWVHQSKLALAELKQVEKQILAAQIRKDIAERELCNHDAQIENAQQVDEFMRGKFTSQQLYRWMSSQIAEVYFRTYQLALDQARRAERAYQHELGLDNNTTSFVQTGHWDSLKRGLLAGDHLHHDLKRMESACLECNVREFEITKHISLLQLDPVALITLKEKNTCEFDLPEALFDLDYPGHYMRRLKMVSLSIPCVVGPYASVNATLKLTKNKIRVKSTADSAADYKSQSEGCFTTAVTTITAIVTSSGQQDSGMFEPNLRDERYLPFEGAGVVSTWGIELPGDFRQFDYDTISDVVLHLRYTARDGGEPLKQNAVAKLEKAVREVSDSEITLSRFFSLRHEFTSAWHRFLDIPDGQADHKMTVDVTSDRFPFLFQGCDLAINKVLLFLKLKESDDYKEYQDGKVLKLVLTPSASTSIEMSLAVTTLLGPLPFREETLHPPVIVTNRPQVSRTWTIEAKSTDIQGIASSLSRTVTVNGTNYYHLDPEKIDDIGLAFCYSVNKMRS